MSRYPRERIEARLYSIALGSAYRIFGLSHLEEPFKIQPFPSRFCDGASGYGVLYAAVSFETCVVETLVRDRFARRTRRELPLAAILVRASAPIATKPNHELKLLDLRGSGCVEIGAPTDAAHARHLAAGQALGRAVHEEHRDIDGFIYSSRLTGDDCIAVFGRAAEKLMVLEAGELKDHPQLPKVLEQHRIQLVDD
jgi:hypothetical protein